MFQDCKRFHTDILHVFFLTISLRYEIRMRTNAYEIIITFFQPWISDLIATILYYFYTFFPLTSRSLLSTAAKAEVESLGPGNVDTNP